MDISSLTRSLIPFVVVLFAGTFVAPRAALSAQGECSQPLSVGVNPVASDCLFILQAAIGLQTCTPICVCDPTGDGNTTASDALTCLKHAVNESITLLCPCDTTTTTTGPTTTTTMSGGGTANCTDDGSCLNDDCVCTDCDNDPFCRDPGNCNDNGSCNLFTEGCVCADCMMIFECLDN